MVQTATKFIKNISFSMIADLSNKISKFLLIIFISNSLGVSSMGGFSIALTFLGFGILFSNWGFGNLLTREISRDKTRLNKFLTNYAFIRIIFALFSILLINLITPLFSYSEITNEVIKILSISIIATTLIKLYYALFTAYEDLKFFSFISISGNIVRLLLSILILINGGGLVAVAVIYSTSEFLILIFSTILTKKYLKNFHIEINIEFALNQILKALPFFWIGILVMLDTRTEILILSWFFDERIVGYYTAVNTILGGLTLLSEAVRNSILPIVTKLQKQSAKKLNQVVYLLGKYLLVITIPISLLVFFQAENILLLLFNIQSSLSYFMLKTTIWIFISYSLTVVVSSVLMAYNLERKVAFALLTSGGFTVLLNLLLSYIIGPEGVALVRLLSSFFMFFICLYFLHKESGHGILGMKTSLFIIISGGIMFVELYLLKIHNELLLVILSIFTYSLSLLIFRVIQTKDISLWIRILKNFTK